ncbi:MAG: T9SS type A sorting domain-containing protein, partial [Saprospiraceae bacterium]|nr:T9SS type A sorting domain-containing protein [Saprospiraceae bacterium]
NVVFRIFDSTEDGCNLIREYEFSCSEDTDCSIYDMTVLARDCNDHNQFYAILKFKTNHHGNHGFRVKVNGSILDTLEYGKDFYELGPFDGDCETIYKFLIQDIQFGDCAEDFSFPAKICCETECNISNPVVSYSSCVEGKFHLTLNFDHIATTQKFRIKINGVTKGPYSYLDLPVVLENLEENKAYEIIVWDIERESCRLILTLPAIDCTTGTGDEISKAIRVLSNNELIEVVLDEIWLPSNIRLMDMSGKIIYVRESQSVNYLDISSLPSGMYLLRLSNDKHNYTKKILKY